MEYVETPILFRVEFSKCLGVAIVESILLFELSTQYTFDLKITRTFKVDLFLTYTRHEKVVNRQLRSGSFPAVTARGKQSKKLESDNSREDSEPIFSSSIFSTDSFSAEIKHVIKRDGIGAEQD